MLCQVMWPNQESCFLSTIVIQISICSVGSLIGVTLCLVSMCREGAAANIAHVRSMQEQLAMALEFATASDSNYQVALYGSYFWPVQLW